MLLALRPAAGLPVDGIDRQNQGADYILTALRTQTIHQHGNRVSHNDDQPPEHTTAERPRERLEVQFLVSAPGLAQAPAGDDREIAFAGRSNAGKSSVLNRLTGNRQTAKVSKTPGRTQLLNFFEVRGGGRLVDLPGYGYAKAARNAQQVWQQAVNHYLAERPNLVGVVLVMDIRHPLQPFDLDLLAWAAASGVPLLILLNKADKLKYGAQQNVLQQVRSRVREVPGVSVMTFSALRGLNVPPLLQTIEEWLAGADAGPVPEAEPDPVR